jgi:hypothetical protein
VTVVDPPYTRQELYIDGVEGLSAYLETKAIAIP